MSWLPRVPACLVFEPPHMYHAVAVVAAGSPEQACKDLVALAHKRWEEQEEEDGVVDDITAVVVWFRPLEVRDGVAPVG